MKGIVFTEFLELVEKEFGYAVLDRITSLESLQGHGAYTSVGNYPHGDMLEMLKVLSEEVDVPVEDLVRIFGQTLISSFYKWYASYFDNAKNSLEFLSGIETVIHSDVRKLYQDVRLPSFDCEWLDENTLVLEYQSMRPMAALAEGAILGSIAHYGDNVEVAREPGPTGDGHSAKFTLKRRIN